MQAFLESNPGLKSRFNKHIHFGEAPAQALPGGNLRDRVRFGRPSSLKADQAALIRRLLDEGKSAKEVAKAFGVHRATIYIATSCPSSLDRKAKVAHQPSIAKMLVASGTELFERFPYDGDSFLSCLVVGATEHVSEYLQEQLISLFQNSISEFH